MKEGNYKESPSAAAVPAQTARTPLSAVLITLNAASQIGPCLASVAFADEILVVDSGSTDDTVAIARRHGARVIHHEWLGFGPQKRFAVGSATHDWVLCVDADERVTPQLRASIEAVLVAEGASGGPTKPQAWIMARANVFLGRVLRHGEGYPDWNLRLFHRDHASWSPDPVHENVVPASGVAVGTLAGDLIHESSETLSLYLAKQNRYTDLQAQRLFESGERASTARLLLAPLVRFLKFYLLRRGFLDGLPGLIHTIIGCQNSFFKYAKLRELAGREPAAPGRHSPL